MKELYQKVIIKYGGPVIVILMLLLWASLVFGADVRVSIGMDVVHKPGMEVISVKVGAIEGLVWKHNAGIGMTYDVGGHRGLQAGLGGIYTHKTDDDVGTHANFLLRGSYCAKRWGCFSMRHISHGAFLGIAKDKANSGLNFLTWEASL